ncbi:hypothetical protein SUGI_0605850 [Cryptomeria japonica]|uniref:uncharacterized protein LOC131042330 isoform X1 n=1 Tax=Cryptomeria japonica TaxID=3369 RepID=UPI00241491AE|nr:uncharacterized protein LOC131042330 isoform X1 [Cryptomeria japonica]GLJ30597.1 hypothetical protein SUGI_0605850 [Cryptomeria japonica]
MGKEKKEGRKAGCSVAHERLSLENYAQIYDELRHKKSQLPSTSPRLNRLLTRENIRRMLKIHGFSASTFKKEALLEGLQDMEIFNPHRSSADIGNFDCDLSTEEMERDLESLGWVECPSKSVNGFMPFPQSLMSAPNPVFTKVSNSEKKISSLSSKLYENEGCKQLLSLQSATTTCMQHLSKSVTQIINSGPANASDEERLEVATSSSVSCKSKVDNSDSIAGL